MITEQNLTVQQAASFVFPQQSTMNPFTQSINILQCRICLQTVRESSPHVITPCKCSGSVKYVHFKCMSQWICRNVKKPIHQSCQKDSYQCQMCKQQIIFETQAKIQCISCDKLKQKISENRLLFFLLLLSSIGLMIILIFCTYIALISQIINLADQRWFQSVLLLLSLFLLLFLQILATYFLVKKFLFNYKIFIVKIYSNSNGRNRSSSMSNSEANLMSNRKNGRVIAVQPVIENIQQLNDA